MKSTRPRGWHIGEVTDLNLIQMLPTSRAGGRRGEPLRGRDGVLQRLGERAPLYRAPGPAVGGEKSACRVLGG